MPMTNKSNHTIDRVHGRNSYRKAVYQPVATRFISKGGTVVIASLASLIKGKIKNFTVASCSYKEVFISIFEKFNRHVAISAEPFVIQTFIHTKSDDYFKVLIDHPSWKRPHTFEFDVETGAIERCLRGMLDSTPTVMQAYIKAEYLLKSADVTVTEVRFTFPNSISRHRVRQF